MRRPYLTEVKVQFEAANASSLDYKIIAIFQGEAASSWFSIPRVLQRCAVEVCNEEGWEIPFAQMTLHLPTKSESN